MAEKKIENSNTEKPKITLKFKASYLNYVAGDIASFRDDVGQHILKLNPEVAVKV